MIFFLNQCKSNILHTNSILNFCREFFSKFLRDTWVFWGEYAHKFPLPGGSLKTTGEGIYGHIPEKKPEYLIYIFLFAKKY